MKIFLAAVMPAPSRISLRLRTFGSALAMKANKQNRKSLL
jgi:hypothetical protein